MKKSQEKVDVERLRHRMQALAQHRKFTMYEYFPLLVTAVPGPCDTFRTCLVKVESENPEGDETVEAVGGILGRVFLDC